MQMAKNRITQALGLFMLSRVLFDEGPKPASFGAGGGSEARRAPTLQKRHGTLLPGEPGPGGRSPIPHATPFSSGVFCDTVIRLYHHVIYEAPDGVL